MKTEPLFSVVIPTYNRASLITKTIKSVINQRFADFEIIVVDDGSTDDTSSVVRSISDERITYLKTTNQERGAARNHGVRAAKGQYITFLDSDDLFYPEHLERASAEVENGSKVFWSPYEEIDSNGNSVSEYTPSSVNIFKELIHKGNIMSCHGVFIAREIFNEISFTEDRALAGSEDLEFWLRLGARHEIKRLPIVSNALVHHDGRSVFNFDKVDNLISRKELMLSYLRQDNEGMAAYGAYMNIIQSRAYSYIALHSAMNKSNSTKVSWKYLVRSIKLDPSSVLSKRALSTVKKLIQRLI